MFFLYTLKENKKKHFSTKVIPILKSKYRAFCITVQSLQPNTTLLRTSLLYVRNYDHLTLSELGMTFLAAGFLAGRASWLRTSWLGGYSSVKHGRSFLEISISL